MKKDRRIITFILLPFVIFGIIYIQNYKKASEVTAIDLLAITYNGTSTPDPVFTLNDLKPGDVEQKCFSVKNVNTTDSFDILMKGNLVSEEKSFADILEIIVSKSGENDIYGGSRGLKTFQNYLDETSSLNLGNFSPGMERTFCIKAKFPSDAGNEFQQAKLIFNLVWTTEITESLIPPECRFMTIERIIEGTEGSDKIHGSTRRELILGKGGNDKIRASSGDDCIVGGDGNDNIQGESGNEVILGGEGNDYIDSGKGNDTVFGGGGNDNIDSGSENDVLYGGDGNDNIDLGSGNDRVWGENGNDNLDGGDGVDELYGGNGNDVLRGGSGNDRLFGEVGNDTIHAYTGDDYLDGGLDYDNLHGNIGNDTCLNGEVNQGCEE